MLASISMEIEQSDKIVLYELQLERTEELSRKAEEGIREDFEELRNNILAADERLELQENILAQEILLFKEKKAPAKLINELIEKVKILASEIQAEHANYLRQSLEVWAQEALRRRNLISERNAYLLQQISILKKQRDSLQEKQAEEDPLDYQQAKKEWEEENAHKVAEEIVQLNKIRAATAADHAEAGKALEELTLRPEFSQEALEEKADDEDDQTDQLTDTQE